MRQFRLVVMGDSMVLERRLKNGQFHAMEIYPDKITSDARLLDNLLRDLSGTPKAVGPAFPID